MNADRNCTLAVIALVLACSAPSTAANNSSAATRGKTVQVAGSGVDHLHTAIVHSQVPTETGMVQRSTETVELTGDIRGRVLYHVTSVFDFAQGTLLNTGDQVFSGTILGSAPVLVHDDEFRFKVNLTTGEEAGQVYLFNHIAGPKVRCLLDVVGTGVDGDGNPTFDYSGVCSFRSQ